MSYKAAVLYDYPIAYYPLDDLTTVDLVDTFTAFLAQFATYQDVLDNISSYANIYGDIAYDHSGCENDGNYIGDPAPDLIPLVAGNSRATNITNTNSIVYNINNDYTATATTSQFGTASSSDNDFTIEFWFYPQISSTDEIALVADPSSEVGVFYEKGNITFKADTESISYTLPYLKKSFHVACIYTTNSLGIYIDGALVASKALTNFVFTNSTISLISGPTPTSSDYFLINSVAIYRYSLSLESMLYHIQEAQPLPAINVAGASSGEVFSIYDNDLTTTYRYSFPTDKSWTEIIEDGLTYFDSGNYLQITPTTTASSSTIVLDQFISVPSTLTIDSSKIEWVGDNGVSVSISSDGSAYTSCTNGQQIPGYTLTSFGSLSGLYIRITFTSSDTSKFLPKLYSLILSFYNDQALYSQNGDSYISTLAGEANISNFNITFGAEPKNILSRDFRNGVRTVIDSTFEITTTNSVQTLEFFYTPATLTDSGLISTVATNGYAASNIYWHNSGAVSKTNISAIYVNGVNKSSETNVSNIFRAGHLHHVLIVFGSAVSGEIRFNYSVYGSVSALYQNIALYPTAFNSTAALNNYDYYRRRSSLSVTDTTTLSVTEDGAEAYNNDWVVIQSA
jgi:hypothetical protein